MSGPVNAINVDEYYMSLQVRGEANIKAAIEEHIKKNELPPELAAHIWSVHEITQKVAWFQHENTPKSRHLYLDVCVSLFQYFLGYYADDLRRIKDTAPDLKFFLSRAINASLATFGFKAELTEIK